MPKTLSFTFYLSNDLIEKNQVDISGVQIRGKGSQGTLKGKRNHCRAAAVRTYFELCTVPKDSYYYKSGVCTQSGPTLGSVVFSYSNKMTKVKAIIESRNALLLNLGKKCFPHFCVFYLLAHLKSEHLAEFFFKFLNSLEVLLFK